MSLNMKKEIRAELRILKKAFAKVIGDKVKYDKRLTRLDQEAIRQCNRTRKAIARQMAIAERRADKHLDKIGRRIAILEGRLA